MNNYITDELGNLVDAGGGKIHTGPFGSQLHASDYVLEGIPCIMPANIKNNKVDLSNIAFISEVDAHRLSKYIVEENDIVYSRRGDVTQKALIREEEAGYFCGTGCLLLRPGKNFDARFLVYYLSTLQMKNWIVSQAVGATMPNLNTGIMTRIPFFGPEKAVQKKIADTLTIMDEKIELNNKINTELERIAKTLHDYWFIQFDFPDENGKLYKSSGGEMVWSDGLKRDIPKGWEVENLKNNSLTKLVKPGIRFFDGNRVYLATADVIDSEINFKASTISFETRESRANMQPILNSIWFAKMKNSKKVTYFGEYSKYITDNFILSTGFAGLECLEKHSLEYVWGYVNSEHFEMLKDRLASGATQEAINNDSMANIPLIIPHDHVLKKYHQATYQIYEKMYFNQIENQKLAEFRDWLLPMLMNGQVSIV